MWQSTLADSFLADFDDDDDAWPSAEAELGQAAPPSSAAAPSTDTSATPSSPSTTGADPPTAAGAADVDANGTSLPSQTSGDGEEEEEDDGPPVPLSHQPSSLSPLLTSGSLSAHVSSLSSLLHSPTPPSTSVEMSALSSSIRYTSSIDTELTLVHRFLRSLYALRYSELEQLLSSPTDYARAVLALGNFGTVAHVGLRETEKELQSFLPHHLVLSITVTATTSGGRQLTADEWTQASQACHTILTLHTHRNTITSYMEGRMSHLAPNLSALVGSTVAAHLISVAGGLRRLSEIPACNLQVLGTRKQRTSALSSTTQDLHVGVIAQSSVLQACPTALRRRAVRLLAGKVALACRMDSHTSSPSGEGGRQLLTTIQSKLDVWQQPPPSSVTKALPAPLAQSNKKRRGGKRYRKERERSQLSELHKAKHRMAFGKEELVDEYTGEEFGMVGQGEGGGQVRAREVGVGQKLSNRLSKDMQRRLGYGQGGKGGGGGGTVTVGGGGGAGGTQSVGGAVTVIGGGGGGTASSIAFTPVQGMELVNNEHKRMKAGDGERYFAATATFLKLGKQQPDKKPLPVVPKF